ncbi:MAG: hypothetical protein Q9214_003936 [Letrouitia sp. 1 TL-2023]
MSPPYPNTTNRCAHQECPVPIRNTDIRPTSLLRTPEQLSSNRTSKNSAQPPYEKNECIHSSILPNAEDLGDERRKQRIVPTGRETGGRGGYENAGEPEGEDAGCSEEERKDKRVLPTEAVTGVAGQDARHGIDGVAGGEKIAAFGDGETEDYGVRRNEGQGELGTGRLEGFTGQLRRLEDECNKLRPRVEVVISEAEDSGARTWRNAATTEKRNVCLEAKTRETWVFRLSGLSTVELAANWLRGTAQAIGNPAIRLKPAQSLRVQRPPTELSSARITGEKMRPPTPPPAKI